MGEASPVARVGVGGGTLPRLRRQQRCRSPSSPSAHSGAELLKGKDRGGGTPEAQRVVLPPLMWKRVRGHDAKRAGAFAAIWTR
eukprot:scaffold90954_cov24-Tisochrysis_lutea.AAC.1